MVDRQRVLIKLDELKSYIADLKKIMPKDLEHYRQVQIQRSCERLLQLSIECTIDICKKLIIGNRLGVPEDEVDLFEKLKKSGVLSFEMVVKLKQMRSLRNILVHEYAEIDDVKVMEMIATRLSDFELFEQEILKHL